MKELPKVYDPRDVESRIYQMWMDGGCFKARPDPDKKPFSIVMPPPNVTGQLHMGHALDCTLQDILTRFKRMQGYDVMFLTGTDEHGQKIETKAEEAGMTPQAFVDRIVDGERGVRDLWKLMNISNDRFIRTTDDYHCAAVQKIFKTMYEEGRHL